MPRQNSATLTRQADSVVLSGEPTQALWGKPIEKLRLFAAQEGRFEPIAYQIDKKDPEGSYLISQTTVTQEVLEETGFDPRPEAERRADRIEEFESRRGRYERDLQNGRLSQIEYDDLRRVAYFAENTGELDYNDELVFMARDAGDKIASARWPTQEGVEIELTNPVDGTQAWAYLLYFPIAAPPRSPKDYIAYDPQADRVESKYAILDFIDNKPLILEKIIGKQPDGSQLPNLLDRFKLRIKIKPTPLFCIPLNFDENNTKSFTVGYKDGPIRVIRRNIFWITFAGIKVPFFPKAVVYYVFYDNALVAPTEIYNPFNPRYVLCDGSIFTGGVDLRKSTYGTEVYTHGNREGIVLDGQTSEAEKNLVRDGQDWIVAYRPKDRVGIIVRVLFDKELMKKGARKALRVIDDANASQPPEDEPGVHFMGYDVDLKHFPKGKYNIYLYQYIAFDFEKGSEQPFLHILDHPLAIKTRGP